jgi:hypothetical protein
MGHDPLGLAWPRTPMRSHTGVNVCEQEPSQLHGHCAHLFWPKAPCIEPTGEMEGAAAAMHDAIEPRAQAKHVAIRWQVQARGDTTAGRSKEADMSSGCCCIRHCEDPWRVQEWQSSSMVINDGGQWWPSITTSIVCHHYHLSLLLLSVVV